jgi:cytoskeletal protein CcmA (bactofilin family)
MTNVANIGKSLHIKGELSGDEDLTVDGTVEGKITLNGHSVTIGQNGSVTGEIHSKSVVVGGQVRGNITAVEKVEVAATGHVLGDVRAPRVVVADGAKFKGRIDMDTDSGSGARAATSAASTLTGSPSPYHTEAPVSVTAATS